LNVAGPRTAKPFFAVSRLSLVPELLTEVSRNVPVFR